MPPWRVACTPTPAGTMPSSPGSCCGICQRIRGDTRHAWRRMAPPLACCWPTRWPAFGNSCRLTWCGQSGNPRIHRRWWRSGFPGSRRTPTQPLPLAGLACWHHPILKLAAVSASGATPWISSELPGPNDSSVPPDPSDVSAASTASVVVNPPTPPMRSMTPCVRS